MRLRISTCTVAVAIGVLAAFHAHGQDSYIPPRGKKMVSPQFPPELRQAGQEGWVLVTFMVDRAGKAYEVAVVDSNGIEALEKSAVANMETAGFQPAKLGRRTTDAVHRMNYTFLLTERTPLSNAFRDSSKPAAAAIVARDRRRADELLASMQARSLEEDALLNLLRFQYHKVWGTPAQQLIALKRATGIEDPNAFLHPNLVSNALRARLELQIQLHDFGGALRTWAIIGENKKTAEFSETFQTTIDDISLRRIDVRDYTVAGELDHRGSWFSHLLKRKFTIEVSIGEVSRLKLRCERGFFSYPFEARKQYEIDDKAGACQLQVIGAAKTRLALRQS